MRLAAVRLRAGAVVLAVAVSLGILASFSSFSAAQAQVDTATLQQERDRLFQAMLKDPTNLDLMFAYAQVTIALGDFDAAIATYERMLIFNPDLPRIHLEVGVLYFRQGSYQEARLHFDQALAGTNVPPGVVAKVEEYRAQIDDQMASNHFEGSVFFGLRYQTNANSGPPEGTRIDIIGDTPVEIEEGTGEGDVNGTLSFSLKHEYDLGTNDYDRWVTDLFGYGAIYGDQTDLNLGTLEIKTGPRINNVLSEMFSVRPYAVGSWIGLDESTYYWSFGGGLQLETRITPRVTLLLDGQYRERRYAGENEDRTGHLILGSGSVRWVVSPRDMITFNAAVLDVTAEEDFLAYIEAGGSIAYTHLFTGVADTLGGPLAVTAYAGGRSDWYDDDDPLIEPGTTRVDKEWRVGASAVLQLGDGWSAVLMSEYRDVHSNVALYSYDNFQVTVGALWRF